jgi:hypothetical protein
MIVSKMYSHSNGSNYIVQKHLTSLQDIIDAVTFVNGVNSYCKESKENNKQRWLLSPAEVNKQIENFLRDRNWNWKIRLNFKKERRYWEMDGIKDNLGLEVQLGKYFAVTYDLFMKIPLFIKYGIISSGIEIVPMKNLQRYMSSGVPCFEKHVVELREANHLQIPILIVGIDLSNKELTELKKIGKIT